MELLDYDDSVELVVRVSADVMWEIHRRGDPAVVVGRDLERYYRQMDLAEDDIPPGLSEDQQSTLLDALWQCSCDDLETPEYGVPLLPCVVAAAVKRKLQTWESEHIMAYVAKVPHAHMQFLMDLAERDARQQNAEAG